jgi:Flp pilus assembly pilin Flp
MSTLLAAALAMVFNFRRDQRGAGAVEYALVAGLITLVIISAVGGIGSAVSRTACGMAKVFGGIASGIAATPLWKLEPHRSWHI